MRSSGTPSPRQTSMASLSGPRPSSSSPPKTVIQTSSKSSPKPYSVGRRKLHREVRGLLLEVVAHREVAEHLEEGEVPERDAHVLDVHRAKRLLARRQPPARRLLLTPEVGLEGMHAGRGEQNAGVIAAGNQRRRRHAKMAVPLKERQKSLPDLGSLHRGWSLGVRPTLPGARRQEGHPRIGDAPSARRCRPTSRSSPRSEPSRCPTGSRADGVPAMSRSD